MSSMIQYANELFPDTDPTVAALSTLSTAGREARGAVFTRHEVVEFILNLVEYTPQTALSATLLEPSFGEGDFLFPATNRLLHAWEKASLPPSALKNCIRAVELHSESFELVTKKLLDRLSQSGISPTVAEAITDKWLIHGDFLQEQFDPCTHIVGNPPYVRQEELPEALLATYRAKFHTIYDRADLYVPFIEKALSHLTKNGKLSYICSDRWMKNKYGKKLRQLIHDNYALTTYIDMVDTLAFDSEVIAYPGIFVIANTPRPQDVTVVTRPKMADLPTIAQAITQNKPNEDVSTVQLNGVNGGPWLILKPDKSAILNELEARFPTIEESGCKVGIGVATGADRVYIQPDKTLTVEPERKLKLVKTRDIADGTIQWKGDAILNPFNESGEVVALDDWPLFAQYIWDNEDVLLQRNVAKRNKDKWYRTIDRIYPALAKQPKLLIPDIKGAAHIVYEGGTYYPHHNLYFITSVSWNLLALQNLLKCGLAQLFVEAYSVKMRGDFLRFQAQYLRKIRLPRWESIPKKIQEQLIHGAQLPQDELAKVCTACLKLDQIAARALIP